MTIQRVFLILPLLVFSFIYSAAAYNTDSLLIVLDNIIRDKGKYESLKQSSITRHKERLANTQNDIERFRESGNLFFEYRTYKLDSAMYYALKRVNIAANLGIEDSLSVAKMNEADGLKGLGKYNEGLALLNSLPKNRFTVSNPYYYHLFHSITLSLSKNAYYEDEISFYNKRLRELRDTIAKINKAGTVGYVVNRGELLKLNGKYDEALELMLGYMKNNPEEACHNATYLCSIADIYKYLGNKEAQKYYLTLGTIEDKRACVKTYTSLQNLASLLFEEGDTERAYNYITCALEDVISSKARTRLVQVAEYMPIINSAYAKQQKEGEDRKTIFIAILTPLLVLLAVMLYFLYKRNRKLHFTRLALDRKNEELVSMNESLNLLNGRLKESNKIKEVYIAQLFNICSGYIDNIEKYRLTLSRKLKSGKESEVVKLLNTSQSAEQLKEFFHNFDMIFLDLFPNFVESFNGLLQPGEQIVPKEGELLTPELRIYALVRLGINDSTKIASLLHYSSQTVYNYRLRVRNKAQVSKDEFVERVQKL